MAIVKTQRIPSVSYYETTIVGTLVAGSFVEDNIPNHTASAYVASQNRSTAGGALGHVTISVGAGTVSGRKVTMTSDNGADTGEIVCILRD
jgi:hypothetical protein